MKKRNVAIAVMPLFFSIFCSGQAVHQKAIPAIESQKANYTIAITPPSEPLSLKGSLLVEVVFTNTTNSDIYMDVAICKICTPVHVFLTKDGNEVETTALQRRNTGRGSPSDFKDLPHITMSGHAQRYHPGIFWKFSVDLRTLYKITEPGQYTVSAKRTEDTPEGKVVVKSKPVTLDIIP